MNSLTLLKALCQRVELNKLGLRKDDFGENRNHVEVRRYINKMLLSEYSADLNAVADNDSLYFVLLSLLTHKPVDAFLALGAMHNHAAIRSKVEKKERQQLKQDIGEACYQLALSTHFEGSPIRDFNINQASLKGYGVDLVASWWHHNQFEGARLFELLHPTDVQTFEPLTDSEVALIAMSLQSLFNPQEQVA